MTLLCRIDDVPDGETRGFTLEGDELFAVNVDGHFRVYLNWCPHLGIELNFMPNEFLEQGSSFIVCANHGALFRIEDGLCLSGPCAKQSLLAVPHERIGDEIHVTHIPTPDH